MLYLTIGVPASGKSTLSQKWYNEKPGKRIVIDRDSLRKALYFDDRKKTNEKLLLTLVKQTIEEALMDGFEVMLADTNLYKKTREEIVSLVHSWGFGTKLIWLDITLKEALKRNAKRREVEGKNVSDGYVRGMFVNYLKERYPHYSDEELDMHYLSEKGNAGLLE